MKVTVVRTGGFAGLERRGEADTASDPVLRGLIERIDLTTVPAPGQVPDQFLYEITVAGRTVQAGESSLTGPLRELVHHVLAR